MFKKISNLLIMNLIFTLNNAIQENKLNLTVTELNWLKMYIKLSEDVLFKIERFLLSIIHNFQITYIPYMVLKISTIIKNNLTVIGLEDLDMTSVFIKFLLVSLVDGGVLPLSKNEKEQFDQLILSSISLLNLDMNHLESKLLVDVKCCGII